MISKYYVLTIFLGVYASPAIAGSRPGGLIAACWASLVATGQDGFMQKSRAIWEASMAIKKGYVSIIFSFIVSLSLH